MPEAATRGFCPHCGFNLTKDEPIERDGFVIDPRGLLVWQGKPLRVRPSAHSLIYALAASAPRVLSLDAMLGVTGSEDADTNVIAVQITHARKAFAAAGVPFPIRTVWGRGYRWGLA